MISVFIQSFSNVSLKELPQRGKTQLSEINSLEKLKECFRKRPLINQVEFPHDDCCNLTQKEKLFHKTSWSTSNISFLSPPTQLQYLSTFRHTAVSVLFYFHSSPSREDAISHYLNSNVTVSSKIEYFSVLKFVTLNDDM